MKILKILLNWFFHEKKNYRNPPETFSSSFSSLAVINFKLNDGWFYRREWEENFHVILFNFYYLVERFSMQLETIKLVYCFRVNGMKMRYNFNGVSSLSFNLKPPCVCSLTFIMVFSHSFRERRWRKMFFEKYHREFETETMTQLAVIVDDSKYCENIRVLVVAFFVLPISPIFHLRSLSHWNFLMTVFFVHAPEQNNVQKSYSEMWKWNPLTKEAILTQTQVSLSVERLPGGRKFTLASINIHHQEDFWNTNKMTNFYEWKIMFT